VNNRQKGLFYVREVKKILQGMNHEVEGPGYKAVWMGNRSVVVHADYFGIFDLISYHDGIYTFHQVSDLHNKSSKIKAIQKKNFKGWVWSRFSAEDRRVGYRIFFVSDEVTEGEVIFKG
jgi:hypothetical protein